VDLAYEFLRLAIEQNFAPALHNGVLGYIGGDYGFEKDFSKAIKLYNDATAQGYVINIFLGITLDEIMKLLTTTIMQTPK
jgi:TPR repeat protein